MKKPGFLPARLQHPDAIERPARRVPIVFCGGGAFLFWWEIGVLQHLQFPVDAAYYVGVSAGNIANVVYVCDIPLDLLLSTSRRYMLGEAACSSLHDVVMRMRAWLDALLPENAHIKCSGRVFVALLELPNTSRVVGDFPSREHLIEVLVASISIPGYVQADVRKWMDHCFDEIPSLDPRRFHIVPINPHTTYKNRTFTEIYNDVLHVPTEEKVLCMYYQGKEYARRSLPATTASFEERVPVNVHLLDTRVRWRSVDLVGMFMLGRLMLWSHGIARKRARITTIGAAYIHLMYSSCGGGSGSMPFLPKLRESTAGPVLCDEQRTFVYAVIGDALADGLCVAVGVARRRDLSSQRVRLRLLRRCADNALCVLTGLQARFYATYWWDTFVRLQTTALLCLMAPGLSRRMVRFASRDRRLQPLLQPLRRRLSRMAATTWTAAHAQAFVFALIYAAGPSTSILTWMGLTRYAAQYLSCCIFQ